MQDEVNEKTIALCIQTSRLTADVLKASMRKMLQEMEKNKQTKTAPKGKQTLKKLMEHGAQLTNIEVTKDNIRSFEKVARKYGIDYSIKKDSSIDPPRYLVFFKAKDVDVVTASFKEYAGEYLKDLKKKPSVVERLRQKVKKKARKKERVRTRKRNRGPIR